MKIRHSTAKSLHVDTDTINEADKLLLAI